MKISACDPCLVEGKVTKAGWVLRLKKGIARLRLNICSAHKGLKINIDQAEEMGVKAETSYLAMRG